MMGTVAALYVLAALDAVFSGICAASGRNALINKRGFFCKAMWHGFLWGQVACALGLVILTAAVWQSSDRQRTIEQLLAVGARMATVYSVYAAAVLGTFAIRACPSVDVRCVTSTIGFGPLTVLRPAVIAAGVAWGLATGPDAAVVAATIAIGVMMIPFRIGLNYWFQSQIVVATPNGWQTQ